MRFSGLRKGNLTQSFVSRLPLLVFSWVDDSLLEGSMRSFPDMTARPSGGDPEREGYRTGVHFPPRGDHTAGSLALITGRRIGYVQYDLCEGGGDRYSLATGWNTYTIVADSDTWAFSVMGPVSTDPVNNRPTTVART